MTVIYTKQAQKSLEQIICFLKERLSEEKVLQVRDAIVTAISQLEKFPFSGAKEANLDHLKLEYRRIVVGYYKVIYRITDNSVVVMKVFDTRQHPSKMRIDL